MKKIISISLLILLISSCEAKKKGNYSYIASARLEPKNCVYLDNGYPDMNRISLDNTYNDNSLFFMNLDKETFNIYNLAYGQKEEFEIDDSKIENNPYSFSISATNQQRELSFIIIQEYGKLITINILEKNKPLRCYLVSAFDSEEAMELIKKRVNTLPRY